MQHMQKIINDYDDVSMVEAVAQPVKSSMSTLCALLELGTDSLEEVRKDLEVLSPKNRELSILKIDVKIAKYKRELASYKTQEDIVQL